MNETPNAPDTSGQPANCRRFRVVVPLAVVGGATVLGAAVGMGIGLSAGWGQGEAEPVLRASLLAMSTWLVAGGVGVLALLGVARGNDDRFGVAVLGSSMARMLVALTIAVGILVVGQVEGRTFLTVFLCSGLMALAAETVWAMIRSATSHSRPAPRSSASSGVAPAGVR